MLFVALFIYKYFSGIFIHDWYEVDGTSRRRKADRIHLYFEGVTELELNDPQASKYIVDYFGLRDVRVLVR